MKHLGKNRMAPVLILSLLFLAGTAGSAWSASTSVDIYEATKQGRGEKLGTVRIDETENGLVFTPDLKGLASGEHGFHIHANADCGPGPDAKTGETIAAGAAGGHFDPANTGRHGSPWDNNGHLGDLPLLEVNAQGAVTTPVLAPRLQRLDQIRNRALMIHEGGDNYSDQPKPLGGGGGRMACGIIR